MFRRGVVARCVASSHERPPATLAQQAKAGFAMSCVASGAGLLYYLYEDAVKSEERRLEAEIDRKLGKNA